MKRLLAITAATMLGLAACTTSDDAGKTTDAAPATTESAPAAEADESAAPAEDATTDTEETAADLPQGDGEVIYLVSMGYQHRYWQAVREGAEQAAEEYGYKIEFVGPKDESQITEQLNLLRTAFDTRPAAIGFAAIDPDAASDLLDEIDAAGIPVIAFDTGVNSDVPATTVQTDNYAAAEEAAKHMVEATGGKGTVGIVCHNQTSLDGKHRCGGFRDYIEANAPEMTLLADQVAGEVGAAANAAKSMVQANPDLVGLYGSNEAAASGAIQGMKELSNDQVTVIGFDSGKTQLDAIRAGDQLGAVTQSPVGMGYATVVSAIRALHGEDLPEVTDSGFAWYDKDNMDDPDIASNLYE